jgi:ketosteroid isomerase-like protein
MDTERAALIDRFYAALTVRDVSAVLDLCHDDVEVYKAPGVIEMVSALTPRGRDRVAQWLEGWLASWDLYEPTIEQLSDAGDKVVALVRVHSRGAGSQFDLEEDMADVFVLREGQISRMRLYVSRDEALEELKQAD